MTVSARAKRHDVVVDAASELRIRGCLRRERSARERLAGQLYARLHPVMLIAPSSIEFLGRTWWQLLFLTVPVLTVFRTLLVLRITRPTRVALAALRGTRSARSALTSRGAWVAVVTAIVVFAAADVLFRTGAVTPYGDALHAAALAAVNGQPIGRASAVARLLDVGGAAEASAVSH